MGLGVLWGWVCSGAGGAMGLTPTGAGVVGVPLRGRRGAAPGAGLQGDAAAAQLFGAVGAVVGRRRGPRPQTPPGDPRLPPRRKALPAQVVLLQVGGGGGGPTAPRLPHAHPEGLRWAPKAPKNG